MPATRLQRHPKTGTEMGQILRQERFVWMVAQGFSPHEQTPLPLAMFNTVCFFRNLGFALHILDTGRVSTGCTG